MVIESSVPVVIWFSMFHWKRILSFCHTKMIDFMTKALVFWFILTARKEPSSPRNENPYIFWMSSILISIPKIPIYWFRAHKFTIFPGRITILIFMFWVFSESNLRNHLLFAPQKQFGTLFKTLLYLVGAPWKKWKFLEFQILKIVFSSLSALQWRSVIFFDDGFQKVKNANLLVPDTQKIKKITKKHQKKNNRDQKALKDKVSIFVGAVKFLAIFATKSRYVWLAELLPWYFKKVCPPWYNGLF